ncbi:MAG TPA: hypothetical protein VEL07_10155 [Planctomycetota bacterium]|nr:hypothetical protein [Planctomycetota bacterium]
MRVAVLILLIASLARAEDERVAVVAKNDVEVALIADGDDRARAVVRNRNRHAVAVSFTISASVSGDDGETFSAVLPPLAEIGREDGFPFAGSPVLAGIRIGAVEKQRLEDVPGMVAGEAQDLDGVHARMWTHPSAPGWAFLSLRNDNVGRVDVSYAWYLDDPPRIERQPIPGEAWAGRHGEIAWRMRPPEDGVEPPNRAFDLKAVIGGR